jgi:glucose repression regulatory protein TUP1
VIPVHSNISFAHNTPHTGEKDADVTPNSQDYVLSVAISPDGQWVVSGSKDRSIQFWSIQTGQAQFMLQGHKNSVISIDLARQGPHLASGSGDCMARIWKYEPTQ